MEKKVIDLKGMPIGRAASDVARILCGKEDVDYAPNKVTKTIVEVINLDQVVYTGRKLGQKLYHTHSGYIGHLKTKTMETRVEQDLNGLFTEMVEGMLPKNRLQAKRIKRLKIK